MFGAKSSATTVHEANDEPIPHGCYDGKIFLGCLVQGESGEEVEVIEAVTCRRCGC